MSCFEGTIPPEKLSVNEIPIYREEGLGGVPLL